MKYIIEEDLLKGLIQYLSTRPYAEVHQAVAALQQLDKAKDK